LQRERTASVRGRVLNQQSTAAVVPVALNRHTCQPQAAAIVRRLPVYRRLALVFLAQHAQLHAGNPCCKLATQLWMPIEDVNRSGNYALARFECCVTLKLSGRVVVTPTLHFKMHMINQCARTLPTQTAAEVQASDTTTAPRQTHLSSRSPWSWRR
jgi:hypothetical protein